MSRLISRADIIYALGYTPYPDENPAAYFGPDEYDAHLPASAAPKDGPQFTGPWSFAASGVIHGDATVDGSLFLTGLGQALQIGQAGIASQPGIAMHSSGGAFRRYDVLLEAIGGNPALDGRGIYNVRAAQVTLNGGPLTFWGHVPPSTQPPAPTTLAEVIGVLRAYGLCA